MKKPMKAKVALVPETDLLTPRPVATTINAALSRDAATPPPVIPRGEPPATLEYVPLGDREQWRVERFAQFCAEFPMPPGQSFELIMAQFHEAGRQYQRGWTICRKLYGIAQMILPAGEDPAEYEPKTAAVIAAAMQPPIDGRQLTAEVAALRAIWETWVKREMQPVSTVAMPEPAPREELPWGDDVMAEFGFEEDMFTVQVWDGEANKPVARAPRLNRLERNWFCKRVRECQKQMRDAGAGALMRTCLMNELFLKRFESDMARLGPSSKKWSELQELRQDLEQRYEAQIRQVQEVFPETATAAKDSFLRVISDLNRAHREYYGMQSNKLIDLMFTANEVEVLLRNSPQRAPQYRLGLTVAVMEAQRGLWDPNWKPVIKPAVLRKMDDGFRTALALVAEEMGEAMVDLEKGVAPAEGDDFEDLIVEQPK